MIKARGIYDGEQVRLLEPLDVPPNTEVEVLALAPPAAAQTPADERQEAYWSALIAAGLIKERPRPWEVDDSFEPIPNPEEPISETIIRNRR